MACEWHWLAFSSSFFYFQLTQTNIWMVHWRSWIGLVFVFQLSSFSSSLLGFGYKSGFLAGEVCCMCNMNLQGPQEASKQIWTCCYCLMSFEVSLFVRWKVDQSVLRMDGWTDGPMDELTDRHSHWKNFVSPTKKCWRDAPFLPWFIAQLFSSAMLAERKVKPRSASSASYASNMRNWAKSSLPRFPWCCCSWCWSFFGSPEISASLQDMEASLRVNIMWP